MRRPRRQPASVPDGPARTRRPAAAAPPAERARAEVLELLLRGKNVPAIADELIISQNTVRSHVKRIYRATDVHTRQQLISYCERMGESGEITQAYTYIYSF